MNVDVEVLEKELKYINLLILKCVNYRELGQLRVTFEFLNELYKHLTGKEYEVYKRSNIDYRKQENYTTSLVMNSEVNLIRKYESDKSFLSPLITTYLDELVKCDDQIELGEDEKIKIYSEEEAKELILSFFSRYDKRIYSYVESLFNNKQIQTGIKCSNMSTINQRKLEFYLDKFGELEIDDYTKDSSAYLLKVYKDIIHYFENEEGNEKIFERFNKLLEEAYENLIPIDSSFEKPVYEFDSYLDSIALTYLSMPLKKSYIFINNDELNIESLVSIVHEIGHAIEAKFITYPLGYDLDEDTYYLSEVPSSFFEYEFLKYVKELGIEKSIDKLIYNYHLDIGENFVYLEETIDASPIGGEVDQCQYFSEENGEFTIDLKSRVLYGVGRFIAMLMSYKLKGREDIYNALMEFMKDRDLCSCKELLMNMNIKEEEIYDIDSIMQELKYLTLKYKK